MHRRHVLRAAGLAIGGVALAGCTGPDEEPTDDPGGSGPTTGSTTRRPTDEIRSTTTSDRSTDEIRSTTTAEPTVEPSETPFFSSTEEPPTTGDES